MMRTPFLAGLLLAFTPASAQDMPPSPVRYTEAQEYPVRRTIRLPGSVESRIQSMVASQVAGAVVKLEAREGNTVRKGELLAQLRTTSLELMRDSLTAQLQEAEARLKLAELSMTRARDLFESDVTSQQDYDNAHYDFNARQGRAQSLAAELARVNLDIDLCSIRAPFAGLVVAEETEIGQWITIGASVVELLSLHDLEVRVEVPERYFASLNPGATARVTFESIPGMAVEGKISAVVARADRQARTFPLKVSVDNSEGRIGVGMLAQVAFPAGESYRATVVPKDAVITKGSERSVYMINGDDTVSLVPVRLGEGVGSWIAVEGELKAGNRVVTRGNERLRPGLPVEGEPVEYALP
jgi:RND family efflux transporter MFP subunit